MMKTKRRIILVLFIMCVIGVEARSDEGAGTQRLAEIVADAMSPTNSGWRAIDQAIEKVQEIGEPAVPLLELIVRLDWNSPSVHDDTPLSYRGARAIWIIQRIGGVSSEKVLNRLLRDNQQYDQQIVTALAIINGVDAAYGTIDRAWYDIKTDGEDQIPVAKKWWDQLGKKKYDGLE